MKQFKNVTAGAAFLFLILLSAGIAQDESAIDFEAIMQKIVEVEARQKAEVRDVVFDAEYIEREKDGEGGFREKIRLEKTITLRYVGDSAIFEEEYNEYYKYGERMSEEEMHKVAKEKNCQEKEKRLDELFFSDDVAVLC